MCNLSDGTGAIDGLFLFRAMVLANQYNLRPNKNWQIYGCKVDS